MTPERWDRIKKVFQSALEQDVDEREVFVDGACGLDSDLRREVMRLLLEHRETITTNVPRDLSGQTISHYEVIEKLGEGGMGVVYKAEDTRLHRKVALKFIRPDAIDDLESKTRFLTEAETAAALIHPNVCVVHEIDESGGQPFIAMEYVDGESLAAKIKQRPLPLDEALGTAIQIAEGLRAAHEKGIHHRDVKPANIMLDVEGRAKVMDFGLAHLEEATRITKTGTALGTPAYMSPEQLRGEKVDHRTDIWSLGVVIYEMVAGRLPFPGDVAQAISHAVLHESPEPLTALRTDVPLELEWTVGKALAKDPAERYQHIEEIVVDLKSLGKKMSPGRSRILSPQGAVPTTKTSSEALVPKRMLRLPWAVAAVTAIALLALAIVHYREAPLVAPKPATRRFAFTPPVPVPSTWSRNVVVSPNGRHIAMAEGAADGTLWIQDLDRWQPRALEGTEGAVAPFWSPDSKYIAYAAGNELKKVRVDGRMPTRLCRLPKPRFGGGTWSPDGEVIVFASEVLLFEVPANGGASRALRLPDDSVEHISSPWFLPSQDGARVLVFDRGIGNTSMNLYDLETDRLELLGPGAEPSYSASGHLLYQSAEYISELWSLPFSLETLQGTGKAFVIAQHGLDATVAEDGTLVYKDAPSPRSFRLTWRDRAGEKLEEIGQVRLSNLNAPRLSPDGEFVVYGGRESAVTEPDIWLYDLVRRRNIRLTSTPERDIYPIWSPSGEHVAFSSNRTGTWEIFVHRAEGSGEAKALTDTGPNFATDWSRDGKYLLYEATASDRFGDLWYLERSADGSRWQPKPYLQTAHGERLAAFSPDGRFVAYLSNETGREELYVRPFPVGDDRWPISSGGSSAPRWRSDGRELFYTSQGALMAVPVSTVPSFSMGTPTKLFAHSADYHALAHYVVSADGQRFFVAEAGEDTPERMIRVVQNWYAEFQDR